jgi:aryl-alcohol dehydrogenase-like predicted oxidoreductase
MNFAIGGAQFGLDYGVYNTAGAVAESEITKIIRLAKTLNVNSIDTASDYGLSESVLGCQDIGRFHVTTKLPSHRDLTQPMDQWIHEAISKSLTKLKRPIIDTLIVHNTDQIELSNVKQISDQIKYEKEMGRISKFGLSIYYPEELERIIPVLEIDVVQGPMNVFDRRLKDTGWIQKLYDLGIELEIRSIFLQGLLLRLEKLPKRFNRWSEFFRKWVEWLKETGFTPIEGCLYSVRDYRINKYVVGIERVEQLREIYDASQSVNLINGSLPEHLRCADLGLIIPSNWSRL